MNNKGMKVFVKSSILSLFVLGLANLGYSQNNLTMYNMHTLPQRIHTNPAQISDSRFFIGMPGFSSLHVLYGNNGFKMKDLVSVNDSNQLEVHPMKFYDALEKDNTISLDVNYDLFYLGFKLRKSFFTVGIGEKVNTQFSFPKDFFGLLLIGNAGSNLGKELNFNFKYDLMAYNDINVSWSRAFRKDKWRLGAKVSYLNGIVNMNTERSDLFFKTNAEDFHFTMRSDLKFNTSSIVDTINEDFSADGLDFNSFKSRNHGMGLSFGATYQILPKIVLSASILDLGRITWKDNVQNYETKNPLQAVEFYGLDINDYFNDSADFNSSIQSMLDTIKDKFELVETHNSYSTNLPTKFYIGGNIWVTKRHNFGVLFFGNYYQKKLNPAFTLSYNGKLTRVLGLSVSYSMINRSFVNGGVGLTLNGSAFQYYVVADNVLGMIKFRNASTIDIRTGINFTFRRKDKQAGLSGNSKKLG
jgi:hypothetical protein